MPIRYPAPLVADDRIAVTSPSSGVPARLLPRLAACLDEALARAAPTWRVGYSDISTLLLPLSTRTGTATLHGQALMDTPYRVPAPLLSWLDVASAPPGSLLPQGPSAHHRAVGRDDWERDPAVSEYTLDTPGSWQPLDIGGCIETVTILAGTPYGDLEGFAARHAPEGLPVYVEAAEDGAVDIARDLWRMRLARWFDRAHAVLVGRTAAPDAPGFTQRLVE